MPTPPQSRRRDVFCEAENPPLHFYAELKVVEKVRLKDANTDRRKREAEWWEEVPMEPGLEHPRAMAGKASAVGGVQVFRNPEEFGGGLRQKGDFCPRIHKEELL